MGINCYWRSCKLALREGNNERNITLITFIRHESINADETRRSVTKRFNTWERLYKLHVMSIMRLIQRRHVIRFNNSLWLGLCYNCFVVLMFL